MVVFLVLFMFLLQWFTMLFLLLVRLILLMGLAHTQKLFQEQMIARTHIYCPRPCHHTMCDFNRPFEMWVGKGPMETVQTQYLGNTKAIQAIFTHYIRIMTLRSKLPLMKPIQSVKYSSFGLTSASALLLCVDFSNLDLLFGPKKR